MHAVFGEAQFHFDNNTHFIGFVKNPLNSYILPFLLITVALLGFCYEQKDVSVSVMNRKIDYMTNFCWQQEHISLSVKQNFCKILGTVTMFLYIEQEQVTVVHYSLGMHSTDYW